MIERKKRKGKKKSVDVAYEVEKATAGLFYSSETDAEILPFVGAQTESVTKEILLSQTGNAENSSVEERNFEEFFSSLTQVQDWFGEEEKAAAQNFSNLQKLLLENLRDLKVFKVGSVELDVYAVGLDTEDVLMGIQTKAVET